MKFIFMNKHIAFILLFVWLSINSFSQKQNNTPGSDFYIDTPTRLNLLKDSVIPITVYVHNSECTNCTNYLNSIDVSFKCASNQSFDAPVVFDSLSSSQFMNLFDSYSTQDNAWSSQSFLDSKPVRDPNHTILFTADTDWWIPPIPVVTINMHYFYFNINIPYSVWNQYLCNDSIIDIHVYATIDYDTDEEFWLRVFVSKQSFPKIQNWYRGDTHFHSYFTQNDAESGLPLKSSKVNAKHTGLDWTTTSDHSCDFDNYGISMQDNWNRLGNEVLSLNAADSSFIFMRGMEASIINSQGKTVHCLVYPNPDAPFSTPYIYDGGGDLTATTVNIDMLQDSLDKYHGFCYAAHPFSEGDKLSVSVNGDVWNISDSLSPQNGNPALTMGNVIWNNLAAPSDVYSSNLSMVYKKNIMGMQNWNLWYTLTCTDTDRDPWNTENNSEPFGFYEVPATNNLQTMYRFTQNMEAYGFLLRRGLRIKNSYPSVEHWKLFLLAGSDAHGSFNFSGTDYVYGGVSGQMENNHPGALNTLVYCPNKMGTNGQHVLQALKDGHTTLSSGPILTMTISSSLGTTLPGDDVNVEDLNENDVIIQLQAVSNNLFGSLTDATIVVETQDSSYSYSVNISNGSYAISLNDLFHQLFMSNNLPISQYVAIRAYIQTIKNYTTTEALYYRKQSEKYNSFTNPIWLKTGLFTKYEFHFTDNIKVYPNPATGPCFIDGIGSQDISSVSIISMSGTVYNIRLQPYSGKLMFNVESLPAGVYSIRISTCKGILIKKMVKL